MADELERAPTKRGEASERILHALAEEFPRLHNRQSFLESEALLKRFGKKVGERLSDRESKAIAKTLGRLIGDKKADGAVSEILWLRGHDSRIDLPDTGLIAVSVNVESLREERWIRSQIEIGALPESVLIDRGPTLPIEKSATQETMVELIISRAKEWIWSHVNSGILPLLLTDVSIVHGSAAFDIMINLSIRETHMMLTFAREVIQGVPHVRGTQTMLVSKGYGFSNVSGALDHG